MSYWDDINEGFGAIRYNYYNDRYAYGKNSLNSSKGVSTKESNMDFRAKRLKEIAEMNKRTFGGIKELKTFKINENVELTETIALQSGYIRIGSKGVVTEVNENSYVIDFGKDFGRVSIDKNVVENSFVAKPVTGTRDVLRKTIEGSLKVGDSINIGDRVIDAEGKQYAIEQADVFGRRFKALSENGVTRVLDKSEVKKIAEDVPLAGEEMPSAAGKMVRIVGIDPQSNSIRARGIPAGSQENVVGQVGVVEFAYYPTGVTAPMFRVLLQGYGRRDFTGAELALADQPQMAYEEAFEDDMRNKDSDLISTSSKALHNLANHPDVDVRLEVARHPHTHTSTLRAMGDDESLIVRRIVSKRLGVSNPNATKSDLKMMVATNPSTSSGRLAQFKEAFEDDMRNKRRVAAHPNTHPDILHTMHTDNDVHVRWGVATNDNTHLDTIHAMSTDDDAGIRAEVAAHPNIHPDILHAMHNDAHGLVRTVVSGSPNTHSDTLHAMHTDNDYDVRCGVAMNQNTRPDTLHAMHTDDHDEVRRAVATNPNTHPDILHAMLKDTSPHVRRIVSRRLGVSNPNATTNPSTSSGRLAQFKEAFEDDMRNKDSDLISTSSKALHNLANHPDVDVRLEVARHPHTHTSTLRAMGDDESLIVRRIVSKRLGVSNPNATKSDLKMMVATNPSTSSETIKSYHEAIKNGGYWR